METALAENSHTISFEISHEEENLCRKLIRDKWVRYGSKNKSNLVLIKRFICLLAAVLLFGQLSSIDLCLHIKPLKFLLSFFFLFFFSLTGNSLRTRHNVVYYHGSPWHAIPKGNESPRKREALSPSNRHVGKFRRTIFLACGELAGVWTVCVKMENSHTLLEDAELAHFDLVLGGKMASHMVVSSSHLMYFGSSILREAGWTNTLVTGTHERITLHL